MRAMKIKKRMVLAVLFLFFGASFGCATHRQVMALEKELKQLRDRVIQTSTEAKVKGEENYRLSTRFVEKAEAAAVRAEMAAIKAESAAMKAERSAEIFLYEESGKRP